MSESLTVPTEKEIQAVHNLRLSTVIADDSQWEDLHSRGWEYVGTPSGFDAHSYYLECMVPSWTYKATQEAAKVAIDSNAENIPEITSQDCGRVALASLQKIDMWLPQGWGKPKKPQIVVIANAEPAGDPFFTARYQQAEEKMLLWRHRLLNNPQFGPDGFIRSQMLKEISKFLRADINDLDLGSTVFRAGTDHMDHVHDLIEKSDQAKIEAENVTKEIHDRWAKQALANRRKTWLPGFRWMVRSAGNEWLWPIK